MQIHDTTLTVVRGSLLDQDVDVIVNAANTSMRGGGGIDGAIHRAAGPSLMQELMEVAPHGAPTAQPVLTHGHNLRQAWIIHVAGPVWNGDQAHCEPLLRQCYRRSLEVAEAKQLKSIGFCSISTGIYGYPLELAAPAALDEVAKYFDERNQSTLNAVIFAMRGASEFEMWQTALNDLQRSNS